MCMHVHGQLPSHFFEVRQMISGIVNMSPSYRGKSHILSVVFRVVGMSVCVKQEVGGACTSEAVTDQIWDASQQDNA